MPDNPNGWRENDLVEIFGGVLIRSDFVDTVWDDEIGQSVCHVFIIVGDVTDIDKESYDVI